MTWMLSRALCESLHCSREAGAENSAENFSDGEQSVALSLIPSPHPFLYRGKTKDFSNRSRSGLTFAVLTADRGEELLTSYRAAFHAQTSAQPDAGQESTASTRQCGSRWHASLAKYDRDLRLWKIRQRSLFEDSIPFSGRFPTWGTMRSGELYRARTPPLLRAIRRCITSASGGGASLKGPTLICKDATDGGPNARYGTSEKLGSFVRKAATLTARDHKIGKASQSTMDRNARPLSEQIGGDLNPAWCEWWMGLPLGWTALDALETDRYRRWLDSHGRCLRNLNERPE